MDWLHALLALAAVVLPLAAVWGLMQWQQWRRARARMKRCSRIP
ncbi:hypothetical protein ACG02S_21880 [Roseateles sp. DC23W]|uniref:Uncharacterized protein n=1 Tax=Pelomonas dachongensis TaxID=3299029 RepID=A0ABW7ESR4_9BURK